MNLGLNSVLFYICRVPGFETLTQNGRRRLSKKAVVCFKIQKEERLLD